MNAEKVKAHVSWWIDMEGPEKVLERLRGAASTSGALLPEPRSGAGQRDPLTSSDDAPLPDQADGACPHAASVARQVLARAKAGLEKYGTTCARTDLSRLDWLQHLQEELMDACVYLETLKAIEAQSGVDRVEECPRCYGAGVRSDLHATEATSEPCPICKGTGETRERSGSGNGQIHPPRQ